MIHEPTWITLHSHPVATRPLTCPPCRDIPPMDRTLGTRFVRSLCCALLVALPAAARAGESVRVEILEGPIKDLTWDFAKTKVTESYTEPAFGFVAVPAKYSDQGMVVDRSNPFVLRATQTLALPAG